MAGFSGIINSPRMNSFTGLLVCLLPLLYLIGSGIADGVLGLCGVLLIAGQVAMRDGSWLRETWVRVALLLIAYLLVQSLFSTNPGESLGRAAGFIRFPLAALVVATVLGRNAALRGRFALSLMAVVVFLSFDALLQYFGGTDILGKPVLSGAYPRLTGPFEDPKVGIILVWLCIPALALIAAGKPFAIHPVWRAVLVVATIAAIALSGERMAFMLLVLGLVLGLLFLTRKLLLAGGLVLGVVLALGVLISVTPQEGLLRQRVDSFATQLSNIWETPYGQIWISAGKVLKDNPLTGVGLKQFRTACLNEAYHTNHPVEIRCNLHPHQLYLEWLVETGVIGTSLFLLMLGLLARTLYSAYPAHGKNPFYIGLLVALCLRVWPISTSTSFFIAWSALPFWMLLGAALSYTLAVKQDDPTPVPLKDA